jgi:AcrR family transcriptional regulator
MYYRVDTEELEDQMAVTRGRPRVPRAERVRQVLTAAARAFARSGYAATSMDEIAAEAGISKLMLYRDFEGKRELYEAILESVSGRLAEKLRDDPEGGASLRGPVALLEVAREQPDAFMLVFRHAAREPEFASYAEEFSARAVRTGERRLAREIQDPVALRWTAQVAFRVTIEAIIAWLEVGDPDRDQAFLEAMTVPVSWTHQAAARLAGTGSGGAPQRRQPGGGRAGHQRSGDAS